MVKAINNDDYRCPECGYDIINEAGCGYDEYYECKRCGCQFEYICISRVRKHGLSKEEWDDKEEEWI